MSSKHDLAHQDLEARLSTVEGGQTPSTQPIQAYTLPQLAATDATLKVGVPTTRIAGTYSAGTVTGRWRTRADTAISAETVITGSTEINFTPTTDESGKYLRYYETVTNSVTGEIKSFVSAVVGPILPPDPTEIGEVEDFDFTTGTGHAVTVVRAGTNATRRTAGTGPSATNLGNLTMIGDSLFRGSGTTFYSPAEELEALIGAAGHTATFVGTHNADPGSVPVSANGGWGISDINAQIANVDALAPDTIIVSIGTNDVGVSYPTVGADMIAYLDALDTACGADRYFIVAPNDTGWFHAASYAALKSAMQSWCDDDSTKRFYGDLTEAGIDVDGADGIGDGTHWSSAGADKAAAYLLALINSNVGSGSGGLIEVMAANTKRYEHNAAGTQIGLLCEKAATNRFTNSDDVASATSDVGTVTVTQNYGTAPDDTTSSTRIQVAAGTHSQGIAVAITSVIAASKFGIWTKAATSQSFYIRDPDSGEYSAKSRTGTGWQLLEEQGTGAPPSNHYNWMFYSDGTALDIEVWGAFLQGGTGPQTLVHTTGTSGTRPKEVWTVTLATGSVTRDIQIEDDLGQVQNFASQVIPGGATWSLDADNVTIRPIIAKLRVYTDGSLGSSPPPSPPPPPPPPSGDYPTISYADFVDFHEVADSTATSFTLPARQSSVQTPWNIDGVQYLCEYPRIDGQGDSNFYNEWHAVPLWLWLFRSNLWTATGKRIQYRRLFPCVLLDGPLGEWYQGQVHARLGSRNNTQLWLGNSPQGAPPLLDSIMRDESDTNGGGSSVLLTGNQGVEMWANPGFFAIADRSITARAYALAAIVEVRVINDDSTVYTGSDAKFLAALGGDLYAPGTQNPRLDNSGIPQGADGNKSRWKLMDCSDGAWHPVAVCNVDFCFKKDGPRPPQWGDYTGSWDITGPLYNLTKAQILANPPPFVT